VKLAVATDVLQSSGAAIGAVLGGLRADLDAAIRARRAMAEAVAGPRSSAAMLSALPLAGLAMGSALGAAPLQVLLHSTAGLAALSAGVLLDLAGIGWTLRLTKMEHP
jgi:tight adherence protein B